MLVAFNASAPTSLYTSKGGGPLALSRRSNSCVGSNGLALLRYSFRFRAYRPRPETHPLAGATIMDLTALADFNAAALHGGFGPAVWKRDRAKATLSRRVVELEQSLGVRLIERALRLTEEGRALHERTHGLLAEIDEAGEAITSRAPVSGGRLRVRASVVFAHVVLAAQRYVSRSRIRSSNWRSLPRTGWCTPCRTVTTWSFVLILPGRTVNGTAYRDRRARSRGRAITATIVRFTRAADPESALPLLAVVLAT